MKRWRSEGTAAGMGIQSPCARRLPLRVLAPAGPAAGSKMGAAAVLVAIVAGGGRGIAGSLQDEIRALVSRSGIPASSVGVAVVIEGSGLAAKHNADAPLKPASNQKVLTAAAGIHALGIGHVYETRILATAPLRGGALEGDLIVRGTGDPNISGRFYDDDPTALFRTWARRLRAAGLERVSGDVIADDRYFSGVRLPPSWDLRQENAWYSAQVSALNFNDNCLDFTVRPGSRVGLPAEVEWIPRSRYTPVSGEVKTVGKEATAVGLYRKHGTNDIHLAGRIRSRKGSVWKGNVTVDDPALFFVTVLVEVFREEGIDVAGAARRVEESAPVPAAPHLLVRHTSTLLQDVPIVLKNSQNLHAEALLRAAGVKVAGEGSIAGGEGAIRAYLRARGIPARGLVVRDGSGLSHENRVSAETLVRVLAAVRAEPWFEQFLRALPSAGVDGTLRDRFKSHPHLHGKVFAKTGYINRVSCLSGYVLRDERIGCFSVLANGLGGGTSGAKRLQEGVAAAVWKALGDSAP